MAPADRRVAVSEARMEAIFIWLRSFRIEKFFSPPF
jgi:hypothetical protein